MDYKYDISIIIVNYNGKKYLKNLFESLISIESKGISYEVILVDNASTDDSIKFVKASNYEEVLNLKIIANRVNQGFAEGNNTGVKEAEGQYIVFLNNDTAVTSDWLMQLYNCMISHDNCGMVASKLLFFYDFIKVQFNTEDNIIMDKHIFINGYDYTIDNKFCKNVIYDESLTCFGHTEIAIPLISGIRDYMFEVSFKKFKSGSDYIIMGLERVSIENEKITIQIKQDSINELKYAIIQNAGSGINKDYDGYDIGMGEPDTPLYNTQKEMVAGCGAALMLKKEDFNTVGGFDQRFFMYYEDVDLSFRIKGLGKKIIYCPKAVVRHVHTGSSKEWSPFFAYHVYRNKLLFIYKNISKWTFLKFFLRQIAGAVMHKDKLKIRATMDSFKIAFFNKKCIY